MGRTKSGTWSVCTLVKGSAATGNVDSGLAAHETSSSLSQHECGALLRQVHAGNPGGLQLVCKVSGRVRTA